MQQQNAEEDNMFNPESLYNVDYAEQVYEHPNQNSSLEQDQRMMMLAQSSNTTEAAKRQIQ